MNKDSFLFAVIGLLTGIIIGFVFANSFNQPENSAVSKTLVTQPQNQNDKTQNLNLPPDHPPVIEVNSPNNQSDQTKIAAAIQKAQTESDNFAAQIIAGDLLYETKQFDESLKFYEQANRLRPNSFETIVKLGNAYFDSEKYEAAEKWYLAALAQNPNDVNVRTDLGLTFYLRQPPDLERAIKEYKIALEKKPDHELTLQNLAIALEKKGDLPAAQIILTKLAQINPNNLLLQNNNPALK